MGPMGGPLSPGGGGGMSFNQAMNVGRAVNLGRHVLPNRERAQESDPSTGFALNQSQFSADVSGPGASPGYTE